MNRPPEYIRGGDPNEKLRVPRPKSVREVPAYLKKLIGGFLKRLFYMFTLVWESKPWLLIVMVFMSVYNGLSPVIASLINAAVLNALGEAAVAAVSGGTFAFATILSLLILRFAFLFLNDFISNIYQMVTRITGELVANHIKMKILKKAQQIDLASYDNPVFYEKLENANREAGTRPIQTIRSIFSVVSTVISAVSFVAVLASVSVGAPLLIVALAIPSAVVSFIYRRKNFLYMRHRSKDRRQMSYYSEMITNKDIVKEIRIFGLGELFTRRYKETFSRYFAGIRRLIVEEGVRHVFFTALKSGANCYLFLYIAKKVYEGALKIGDYSLYTGALTTISSDISNLIATAAQIYEGSLFIDNMIDFMAEKPTLTLPSGTPRTLSRHCGHTIEFRGVSFRYPGTERMVLKNINLTLCAGETVVLVGLNGAGKTTLIKLITRLYDPTEGVILLDGHDIRDYKVEDVYDMFGIIFQDFGRYAVTAEENIVFGNVEKGAVRADVERAAVQSNADAFIRALPHGYDTPLMRFFESDGIELSGGQWQKLSIARAFYSDSDILILDEPTASLDAIAEQEIFTQFDRLRQGKTTIFVSHRLSSATTASKILVLEYGELVEEGTHAELMALGGRYHTLFTTQAKRYIDTSETPAPAPHPSGEMPPRPSGARPIPPRKGHPPRRPPHAEG